MRDTYAGRSEALEDIPSSVRPTTCHCGTTSATRGTVALQDIVDGVAGGRCRSGAERVFGFDEIVAARRCMAESRGSGTLVVAADA